MKMIRRVILSATVLAAPAVICGCAADANPEAVTASADPLAAIFGHAPKRGATQLWADNCSRCHNIRSPDAYSAVQWDLILRHMRLRANLTGEEERTILAFLKAGATAKD